jgi:hypothetical protein
MSALRAAFADFKLVRTRGVAQLVMEVPIEEADAALALLGGVPKAAAEKWVGIAPLLESDGDRETSPEKPEPPARPGGRPAPSDGERIRTRAVLLCKDAGFQKWVRKDPYFRTFINQNGEPMPITGGAVVNYLRVKCGIASRAELATNLEAQRKFLDLEAQFRAETGQMAEKRGA